MWLIVSNIYTTHCIIMTVLLNFYILLSVRRTFEVKTIFVIVKHIRSGYQFGILNI